MKKTFVVILTSIVLAIGAAVALRKPASPLASHTPAGSTRAADFSTTSQAASTAVTPKQTSASNLQTAHNSAPSAGILPGAQAAPQPAVIAPGSRATAMSQDTAATAVVAQSIARSLRSAASASAVNGASSAAVSSQTTPGSNPPPPAGSTIEAPQGVQIPAALASPNPDLHFTPEQQAMADKLANQFVNAIGNGNPYDPAYTTRWRQAQSESDQLYKLYFGGQAYVAQNIRAAREAASPAK